MPSLLILRLHPVEPALAVDFAGFLTNLTIKASDTSFRTLARPKARCPDGRGTARWSKLVAGSRRTVRQLDHNDQHQLLNGKGWYK